MVFEGLKEWWQLRRISGFHSDVMSYNPESEEDRLHPVTFSIISGKIDRMKGVIGGSRSLGVWNEGLNKLELISNGFNNPNVRNYAALSLSKVGADYRQLFKKEKSFKGVFKNK